MGNDLSYLDQQKITQFIGNALAEDIGPGDYSTLAAIDENATGRAKLIIKQAGVLAGMAVAQTVFTMVDNRLNLELHKKDGTAVKPGDIVLTVHGSARAILSAERLALNFLQRMSGIATKTRHLVNLLKGTGVRLLDTRKTTPNFRMFEKWAVKIGGGENHRFALYDMIMLKDNHIDYAGGIGRAVARAKNYLEVNNLDLKIEVETRNLTEVKQAVAAGADIILLDNMDLTTLKAAVGLINNQCITEASGGISEVNISEVAQTGVDYISVGALTHSYPSLDMSLQAEVTRQA